MNTDTITERIHQKSDLELRKKLEQSVKWVWDESGHGAERPKDVQALNSSLAGAGLPEFKDMPWIGAIQRLHTEVAFAYLRDRYRSKAVYDFMEKVQSVDEIMRSLPE